MPPFMPFVASRLAAGRACRDAARVPSLPSAAMRPHVSIIALSVLLLGAAHAGQPATPAAMAAYADKLLDEQKIGREGPGVTVLVARGDLLLYKGARGMAS